MIRHADAERRLTGMYPMDFPQIFDLRRPVDISKRDELFHCFKSAGEAASRDGRKLYWRLVVSSLRSWRTAESISWTTGRRS